MNSGYKTIIIVIERMIHIGTIVTWKAFPSAQLANGANKIGKITKKRRFCIDFKLYIVN